MSDKPNETRSCTPHVDRTIETTSTFLKLGVGGSNRPVEALMQWLEQQNDADTWLERTLAAGPLGRHGQTLQSVISGAVDADVLIEMKSHGTAAMKTAGANVEHRIAAMTEYFIAVAAALVHHDEVLTSRDPNEVRDVLLDLATVMPPHLAELLGEAALKLQSVRL